MTAELEPAGGALRRNPWLLCLIRACQMALFPMAILSVFLQREIGFDVTEIMLLQGVFGVAMVLFEFPSGYLADRIGYRNSLVLAFVLWTIAWPIYGYAGSWIGVAAAELLLGIGMSLVSGCDTALLYESLVGDGEEETFARWSGRQTFCGQIAEGGAALAAGWMFAVGVQWPFLAQGLTSALGLLLALGLREPERERPPFADSLGQIKAMVRHVAHDNPQLRTVFTIAVILGMASFIPVWTIQLYALEGGMPDPWLGPMWAVANFSVALAALASGRWLGHVPLGALVLGWTIVVVGGFVGLGLSHALWGFAFYYLITLARGVQSPVVHHREQRLVPSGERAGFVSLRSMGFRLTFLVVGPLVGLAVDQRGQHTVMLALALVVGVAGLIAAGLARRWIDAPAQVDG